MWTDFTASFLFRGTSRCSMVGRRNILSTGRATMRSISRTMIESSWNLSIKPDRAHEQTLEEVSCHGDSTPVIVVVVFRLPQSPPDVSESLLGGDLDEVFWLSIASLRQVHDSARQTLGSDSVLCQHLGYA